MKPRILDLFCGAGGAGMGYHLAGFEVVGVDIAPQPNYPFTFWLGDALRTIDGIGYDLGSFDAIHASPPCQAYGAATNRLVTRKAPRLIEPLQEILRGLAVPYVIENVHGAPLRDPLLLCGSMFGLDVKRHRLFESNVIGIPFGMGCRHWAWENRYPTHARKDKAQWSPVVHVYGTGGGAGKDLDLWRRVMEVPWMQTKAEIAEAIPPAYTKFIGEQLIAALAAERKAS